MQMPHSSTFTKQHKPLKTNKPYVSLAIIMHDEAPIRLMHPQQKALQATSKSGNT